MYWLNFSHFVAFVKKWRVIIFWENKRITGNSLNSLTVVFLLYQHDGYHGQLRQSSEMHSSVLTSVLKQKQLASCSRETDCLFFKKKRSLVSVFVSSSVRDSICATFPKGQTPKSNTWALASSRSPCQCLELSIVPITLIWFLLGTATPLMLTTTNSRQ